MDSFLVRLRSLASKIEQRYANIVTRIRIAWLRYWALERRFRFRGVSFKRAFIAFIAIVVGVYLIIGLPVFGYLVYKKHIEGTPLAIAAAIYPFPVALVGNDVILLKPFSDRLAYLKYFSQQTKQPLPADTDLRKQVVNKLVDEAVTRQWANKSGITVSQADINAAYNKIVQDRGSNQAVETVLAQLYNLTGTEFRRLIPDALYQEKVQEKIIEQVHVKHILVTDPDLANKIKGEVTTANWDAEAKQYSQDQTTRDKGGDLGSLDTGQSNLIDSTLAKAIFSTPPGTIAGPIKSKYGYHIIWVVSKTGSYQGTFDQWLQDKEKQTKIRRILN